MPRSRCIYDFNESLWRERDGPGEFICMRCAAGCNFNQLNHRERLPVSGLLSLHFPAGRQGIRCDAILPARNNENEGGQVSRAPGRGVFQLRGECRVTLADFQVVSEVEVCSMSGIEGEASVIGVVASGIIGQWSDACIDVKSIG